MRIETEGVATEHRWLDELQRSPFAKLVFRETTGTKFDKPSFEDSVPACVVTPLRAGYEAAYVKSWPIVLFISSGPYACAARRRLGCRPGGKRAKAVFDLENGSGTLDDILYKQTGAFIISTWSDELPNVQAQEDEDRPLRVQRFVFQEFFGESEHGYSSLYNSGSAARVIARSPNRIESVMVLEGTSLNSAIVLRMTARYY